MTVTVRFSLSSTLDLLGDGFISVCAVLSCRMNGCCSACWAVRRREGSSSSRPNTRLRAASETVSRAARSNLRIEENAERGPAGEGKGRNNTHSHRWIAASSWVSSQSGSKGYLEARRTAQARALRAPPPSPSLAFSQQQPPSQQPSSSQAAAATFSKMKGGGRSASSGVKPPRGRARTSKIAAPRR